MRELGWWGGLEQGSRVIGLVISFYRRRLTMVRTARLCIRGELERELKRQAREQVIGSHLHPARTQLFYNRYSSFFTSLTMLRSTSATVSATIGLLLAFSIHINLISAAHAGFHVQYPWATRGPIPKIRPEIDQYNPFCGKILNNPTEFSHNFRTFLSFSGHPGDLITALYTRQRVPKQREDFPHIILQEIPIQPSGQLCVNVSLQPFDTHIGDMGVMYFEARDPRTGVVVEYHCTDVKLVDERDALPEDHPAMCAAQNETLIPMPDEWL